MNSAKILCRDIVWDSKIRKKINRHKKDVVYSTNMTLYANIVYVYQRSGPPVHDHKIMGFIL